MTWLYYITPSSYLHSGDVTFSQVIWGSCSTILSSEVQSLRCINMSSKTLTLNFTSKSAMVSQTRVLQRWYPFSRPTVPRHSTCLTWQLKVWMENMLVTLDHSLTLGKMLTTSDHSLTCKYSQPLEGPEHRASMSNNFLKAYNYTVCLGEWRPKIYVYLHTIPGAPGQRQAGFEVLTNVISISAGPTMLNSAV